MTEPARRGVHPLTAVLIGGLTVAVVASGLFIYSGGAPRPARITDAKMNLPTPRLQSALNPSPLPFPMPRPAG